jgi:hypothetical protein
MFVGGGETKLNSVKKVPLPAPRLRQAGTPHPPQELLAKKKNIFLLSQAHLLQFF